MKNEDFESEVFLEAFSNQKDLNIVLYGTGRLTALLLKHPSAKEYHIIGLSDREPEKFHDLVYGLPVMGQKEVEEKADIIVINTIPLYWTPIYTRIRNWKIPIYYRDGTRANDDRLDQQEDLYYRKSKDDLLKTAIKYDVVSFDVFDTLVMRRLANPTDVFSIVQKIWCSKRGVNIDFVLWREKAEKNLVCPALDQIYEEMQIVTGWDKTWLTELKNLEIEVEIFFLSPRNDIVEIYQELKRNSCIEIYIISDTYFPREILADILEKKGILIDRKQMLLSCEYGMDKQSGGLWNLYSRQILGNTKRGLHIGDNSIADDVAARRSAGVDCYRIRSGTEMIFHSYARKNLEYVKDINSSIAFGIMMNELCNSPFGFNKHRGTIVFQQEKSVGFVLLGPLILGFIEWLICQAKKDGITEFVFLSRDGFLLKSIYDWYCSKSEGEKPCSKYLESSRQIVELSAIKDKNDLYERKDQSINYFGSCADYLRSRYALENEDLTALEDVEYATLSIDDEKKIFQPFEKDILKMVEINREQYTEYCKSIGIDHHSAIVDLGVYGTIQYHLSKQLKEDLKGYYVICSQDFLHQYNNDMSGFVADPGTKAVGLSIMYFLESIFTAPVGMLMYIDEYGKKHYSDKGTNQFYFDIRYEYEAGIEEYISEVLKTENFIGAQVGIIPDYAVNILNVFLNGGFEPSERMKKSVTFRDEFRGINEVSIFDGGKNNE